MEYLTASDHEESAYQLLVNSKETRLGLFESLVYMLLILATVASIWQLSQQFGGQPVASVTLTTAHSALTLFS